MFKAQRQIDDADLPSNEAKLGLLALAVEKLSAAGYRYIGMDHFALPDDDLARAQEQGTLQRNFMGYTTHADCDLVGFGMSAISHIGDSFSQNARDLPGWQRAIDGGHLPVWRGLAPAFRRHSARRGHSAAHVPGTDRHAARSRRASPSTSRRTSQPAWHSCAFWPPMDWSRSRARSIAATARGRLLLRVIAMCFDRYLDAAPLPAGPPAVLARHLTETFNFRKETHE